MSSEDAHHSLLPRVGSNARDARTGIGAAVGNAGRWVRRFIPAGKKLFWLIVGILVVVLLIVIFKPNGPQTNGRGRYGVDQPMPVGVATAAKGDIAITLKAPGTVTPLATVTVRPQVSGNIKAINFKEGQMVKAGDVLAEIDPRTYQAALDQAKGTLAKDEATLQNAKTDLARYQALWAQKAVSQQIYDTQIATVRQDEGIVTADKAAVESAQINLGYTKIRSPIAGRVGLRQVDVGNLVQAGQTNQIAVVTQLQPISVIFAIPEDDIDAVMARVNSGAKLQVQAYDRQAVHLLSTGTLSTVDNQVDTTTGTVKLRAMFANPDGMLFPNQFVNAKLLVNTLHDLVVVPPAAIQNGADGAFVFVVKPDKTVAMRAVKLGPSDDTHVSIESGLQPGETVVVDGADRLKDGSEVSIPALGKAGVATPAQHARHMQERFQRILKQLPPAQQEQLKKMSPDERRAWMRAHRGQFHRRGGGG